MKKLFFFVAFVCSMQMMALNLVVEHRSGADLLKDVALIGKWVYVGDDLQLLSHSGEVLAQEPVMSIRKITFEEPSNSTALENITSQDIVVYPNPTQNVLLINGIEAQDLRVFDLQGRLLKTENGTQVNVSNLAEGTYLLQVGTQVVRFIKK